MELNVTTPYDISNTSIVKVSSVLFYKSSGEKSLPYYKAKTWYSSVDFNEDLLKGEQLVFRGEDGWTQTAVYSGHDWTMSLWWNKEKYINVYVAGKTMAVCDELLAKFSIFPEIKADSENIPIKFWYATPQGTDYHERLLSVPNWDDIKGNYSSPVQTKVNDLITLTEGDVGGQLMLLHGPPGTGKTFMIRALAKEWSSWCKTSYIVDPDEFFSKAHYMMNVLLSSDEKKWNLVVVEDAGELLSKDAKERTGQGLSRLLNLTDGLVGQGARLIVLISTNEPFKDLHDAVSRPGRCMAEVEVNKLTKAESQGWLEAHGADMQAVENYSLASLYALLRGKEGEDHAQPATPRKQIGFAPAPKQRVYDQQLEPDLVELVG